MNRITKKLKDSLKFLVSCFQQLKTKNCKLKTILLLFILLMMALLFPLSKGGERGLLSFGVVDASAAWTIEAVDAPKYFTDMSQRSIAIDKVTNQPHIAYGGDHLYHAFYNGTGWVYETVDSSAGVGYDASIAIDSNNKIHISYYDSINQDLKYATNASGSWVTSTIDSSGLVGYNTSIAIDLNNKVHIGYRGSGLKYATNATGLWVITTIDSVGDNLSIAVDSDNKVHISYEDTTVRNLKYATNATGVWVVDTIDTGLGDGAYPGFRTSITVDTQNKVHISYSAYVSSNYNLKYITNASGVWIAETIGTGGTKNSIALDANNKVHISNYGSNGNLEYVTNTSGSWVINTIDTYANSGYLNSIAIDSNNVVAISYFIYSQSALGYATNSSGSWIKSTVDYSFQVGSESDIAIDSNNKVHISYRNNWTLKYITNSSGSWVTTSFPYNAIYTSIAVDQSNAIHMSHAGGSAGLLYTTNASGSWVTTTVDGTWDVGRYNAIAIDSQGKVHISYQTADSGSPDLMYATNASGSWVISTIDSAGSVGRYTSIAIDSYDKVHISYCDATNYDLKYATNASGSWNTSTIDSVGSVGFSTSIALDLNNKVHISYYDNTNYDLKYATNASGSWATSTIDSTAGGYYTSIAVESNNKVHISYQDYPNYDLKYATNASGSWNTSTIDSVGSVGGSTSIAIDSNSKVHISYYDNTNYDLKYATNASSGDTTPPTGSISINSGAAYTNSTSVTLTLSCTDSGSGCSQMQFSNDNSTYSTSEIYATTKLWTLTSGDGTKTVYAKFKDTAGNWSDVYSDTIILDTAVDTTPPTGTISINSGATYTNSTSVTLNLTCSDSGSGCAEVKFSNDNVTYLPLIAEFYSTTRSWTLTSGDGTKTVYVKFKDNAENWASAYSDTIILDTTAPTTTASPAGGTYSSAQSVTLTCNDGTGSGCANIYYTTDGSTPTTSSTVYSSAINISTTTTLKFFAKDNAGNSESVKTEVYTITSGGTINLPKTGQTKCYDSAGTEIACAGTGQDGAIQAGVAWPSPRFTDNSDQTINDNLTGLVWTKDAGTPTAGSCTGGTKTWQDALNYVACLNSNGFMS